MSFRRNNNRSQAWNQWVDLHRDELIAASVPTEIFSDEFRWCRFLEGGGFDAETKWHVEILSPQQAETLRLLIITEFERPDVAPCLRSLDDVIRENAFIHRGSRRE